MRIPFRQMNGKVRILEVTPETTIGDLKKRLSGWQACEDELSRKISQVDIILEDRKLENDQTVIEAGISPESTVQVLFSICPVQCCSKVEAVCDPASLVLVEVPPGTSSIPADAFSDCSTLVKVTVPDSVSVIGPRAFKGCSSLEVFNMPDDLVDLGREAFQGCRSLTELIINPIYPATGLT